MVRGAERPESALCEPVALPLVVSGEVDVLPAERGEVLEQLGVESMPVPRLRLWMALSMYTVFQSAMAAVTRVRPLAR